MAATSLHRETPPISNNADQFGWLTKTIRDKTKGTDFRGQIFNFSDDKIKVMAPEMVVSEFLP